MNKNYFHLMISMLLCPYILSPMATAGNPQRLSFASGDPRSLSLDEIRTLRDTMVRVSLLITDGLQKREELRRGPFENRKEHFVERRQVRVRYPFGDQYMTTRDAEVNHELGLRAWKVVFTGGPLNVWYEVETEGDVRLPDFLIREKSQDLKITLRCDASEGRLLFWCLPSSSAEFPSPRSQAVMKILHQFDADHDGTAYQHGLQIMGGQEIEFTSHGAFTSPRLWSDWSGVKLIRHTSTDTVHVVGETTLLDIEAIETATPENATPRRVRLKVRARHDVQLRASQESGRRELQLHTSEARFEQLCEAWKFPIADANGVVGEQ